MRKFIIMVAAGVLIGQPGITLGADGEKPQQAQAAMVLGQMHSDAVEAIEEGLAFLVIKEPGEKVDYLKKVAAFDQQAAEFTGLAGLSGTQAEQFDAILARQAAMVTAFEAEFAVIDAGKELVADDLDDLEDKIDDFTDLFGPFSVQYFKQVSAELDNSSHLKAALTLFSMHHDLIEGVEEVFGAILLNDSDEADDYAESIKDFQDKADAFRAGGYLRQAGDDERDALFRSMLAQVDTMNAAAKPLLDHVSNKETCSANELAAFENAVDTLTDTYDKLLSLVMQDI